MQDVTKITSVLANVQSCNTCSRISPNVLGVTKITLVLANVQNCNTCSCVSPNVNVTKFTSTNVSLFSSCSTFFSSYVLPNSLAITELESISTDICIWRTCSSLLGLPSRLLRLFKLSDLLMWCVQNARLRLLHYKPAALITAQICYSVYRVLEAAMYLKESFSDALWVSLGIQRSLYLKHDFANKVYVLSCRVKACNVIYFHKVFARLLYHLPRNGEQGLCLLSASDCARFLSFGRRPLSLLFEKCRRLVRPLYPVDNGVVCAGVRAPPHLGGGYSRQHVFKSIEPYVISDTSSATRKCSFRYVDHVDDVGVLSYPAPVYVHTSIPLSVLFGLITLANSRKIAAMHGISVGSRASAAQLLLLAESHSCLKCSSYLTVFSSDLNANQLNVGRATKCRGKKQGAHATPPGTITLSKQCPPSGTKIPSSTPFPPDAASDDLEHVILTKACNRMQPDILTEAGCAVCGELKPVHAMSRLRSVKNFLHVLESPGVTRVERRSSSLPVKEYKGPVLDYSCSRICDGCRYHVRKGKVPRLALANNLWIGKVPEELSSLRYVEKILISKVRHTCAYVKVASGMRKMKANIIAFESPVPKIYSILPPPREDLDDVLGILFTGPKEPTLEDFVRTPFLVRRNAVIRALEWLKLNHVDYADIEISHENMRQYQENTPPVVVAYRESISNKVPEGISVFDHEEEDGTEQGDCAFTVHGLTGEACNSMTPNALKAMALRHLNNGGKVLAVGHSDKFESIWNNPQLYPQMFPWLFPYGLGGIGVSNISDKEHKRHLLMYHDKRFQVDINFPFVAFSHEQMRASSTQSFLLADQCRFDNISERLLNIDWPTLDVLTKRMEAGEHVIPQTDAEKACFQIINDLDAVSGKMHGSTTSKKFMRSEIWSLINFLGAPYWYITLSPADIMHPICIYFADSKEEFKPDVLSPYDERIRLVCKNPVAGARFFDFMIRSFISDVLGVEASHAGFYGQTSGYYGTVEQQGRLTLHLHLLLWIKGSLNPQEMRQKIVGDDSVWRKRLLDWLDRCHTGDFVSGSKVDATTCVEESKGRLGHDYIDPTQSLPIPPPKKCTKHTISESANFESITSMECKECVAFSEWQEQYKRTTDDILLWSNVHSCNRGIRKDGTRKKNKASAGCMDNKWGKCRARFPRMTALKTFIDETGAITMRKLEPWINTFTPLVTYIFRCNTDVTCMTSGTAIKGVAMYVSDYITKSTLKTHVIFDSIRTVFQKNSKLIGETLPAKEKARRFMTKVANLLSAKAEMGGPDDSNVPTG